jgi:hypothetical protein
MRRASVSSLWGFDLASAIPAITSIESGIRASIARSSHWPA